MDKVKKKYSKKIPRVENKAQKARSKQKLTKPKEKVERQIIVGARARLEPRLSKPSEENKKKQETVTNIETNKRLVISLNTNEIDKHLKDLKSPVTIRNANERSKVSDAGNVSPLKKKSHGESLKDIENDFGDEEDFLNFIKQSKQERFAEGIYWTDIEIRDLAYGLQRHGFGDIKKLASEVKTKTENDIKHFLKSRVSEKRKEKTQHLEPERQRGRPKNSWTTVSPEVLETWPMIRKWRRMAYQQMLSYTRTKDYSRPVMSALCNKFFEEEPEPEDPQVINVKLIYKYLADCMNGDIPPQLPPKESALVLDLLREVRLMPIAYDFEEERQFIKDFKNATTFKPFEVKDEFKKKLIQDPDAVNDPNAVSVPEEIFLELSRHKRLLQSFNPLVTPVWMVQKSQEHLEKYFEEPSVYVD